MNNFYLSLDQYSGVIPANELERYLSDACRIIDSLTFNRIVKQGFENLTEFQQGIIKRSAE